MDDFKSLSVKRYQEFKADKLIIRIKAHNSASQNRNLHSFGNKENNTLIGAKQPKSFLKSYKVLETTF